MHVTQEVTYHDFHYVSQTNTSRVHSDEENKHLHHFTRPE
jgi:hypothetical protein